MNSVTKPLRVSREVIQAYEIRTGFAGIGKFFATEGLPGIVEEECRTRA